MIDKENRPDSVNYRASQEPCAASQRVNTENLRTNTDTEQAGILPPSPYELRYQQWRDSCGLGTVRDSEFLVSWSD